jgi:hypothetical protein
MMAKAVGDHWHDMRADEEKTRLAKANRPFCIKKMFDDSRLEIFNNVQHGMPDCGASREGSDEEEEDVKCVHKRRLFSTISQAMGMT